MEVLSFILTFIQLFFFLLKGHFNYFLMQVIFFKYIILFPYNRKFPKIHHLGSGNIKAEVQTIHHILNTEITYGNVKFPYFNEQRFKCLQGLY